MWTRSGLFSCVAVLFAPLCGFASAPAVAQPAQSPPNLIIILTDDQGYADVGFNGCRDIPTPNIDRIAKEGVRCTEGYVTYSVCGPSRAGLMTGRYQDRFGFTTNPTIDPSNPDAGIPLSEKNIAELLDPAGYTSMAVGKWHLGTHPRLRPLSRGFDEFFGFLSGGHNYFPEQYDLNDLSDVKRQWDWYRTRLLRDNERVDIDGYLTDELSDAAVDFVKRRHRDGPFFLYLAYNAPHTPMQATQKYLDRFPDIPNERRRTYAAMVSAVDDGVGRLLDTLDELALAENTIVFFLSDNGGASNNASRNAPLRGNKSTMFEGGLRVPFAVRWTGTLPAGADYHKPVSSLDIAATIVTHAGVDINPDKPLDGVDLVPFLTGQNRARPHPVMYWRMVPRDGLAIRRGDEKLILCEKDGGRMLFNIAEDQRERNNLVNARGAVAAELEAMIQGWTADFPGPAFPPLGSWP
ncbi:MAG: sulfatase-like hydrolase/transferase [Planctomycetota bacterium]